MSDGYVYTIPVQVRLSAPLATAEHGRLLCVKMEEVVQMGFEDADEAEVVEVIALHPREGTLRHIATDKS